MDIRALVTECQLDAALALAESAVRENPLNFRSRTTLFSLLAFTGQYERADQQLTVLSQENETANKGISSYRALIVGEQMRERILCGQQAPQYLLAPPSYASAHWQVVACLAADDLPGARDALDVLAQERPPCQVQIGVHHGWISDADDRVGPVAELFLQDRYVWLPWEQIRGLHIPPPTQLRDLLWTPVVVDLDIGQLQAFMPVLYPRTCMSDDPRVRLGRMTVWRDNDLGLSLGQGARLLALHQSAIPSSESVEVIDIPLLEVGTLQRLDLAVEDQTETTAEPSSLLSGAA